VTLKYEATCHQLLPVFIQRNAPDLSVLSNTYKPYYRLHKVLRKGAVKVKLSLCLTKHHAMKTYWGVEV